MYAILGSYIHLIEIQWETHFIFSLSITSAFSLVLSPLEQLEWNCILHRYIKMCLCANLCKVKSKVEILSFFCICVCCCDAYKRRARFVSHFTSLPFVSRVHTPLSIYQMGFNFRLTFAIHIIFLAKFDIWFHFQWSCTVNSHITNPDSHFTKHPMPVTPQF